MLAPNRYPALITFREVPQARAAKPIADGLLGAFSLMGAPISVGRNEEVFAEGEKAEFLYKVESGCVRTYKILNDGRRQVSAFYFPDDVFGVEAGDQHSFSADAVVPSKVTIAKRSLIHSAASGDSDLGREFLDLTLSELHRAQKYVVLLIQTAQERVAGFLLEMAARTRGSAEIELPMSRQDIADHLGLTIETVSRTLTQLENATTIKLPSPRHVRLCDRAALAEMND